MTFLHGKLFNPMSKTSNNRKAQARCGREVNIRDHPVICMPVGSMDYFLVKVRKTVGWELI